MSFTSQTTVQNYERTVEATKPVEREESRAERIERIMNSDEPLTAEEFELLSDDFAEQILKDYGGKSPMLSDYAVSREGIYAEHD